MNEVFGLQPGSILEVDGGSCVVKYVIASDPEVWAILMPVQCNRPAMPAMPAMSLTDNDFKST